MKAHLAEFKCLIILQLLKRFDFEKLQTFCTSQWYMCSSATVSWSQASIRIRCIVQKNRATVQLYVEYRDLPPFVSDTLFSRHAHATYTANVSPWNKRIEGSSRKFNYSIAPRHVLWSQRIFFFISLQSLIDYRKLAIVKALNNRRTAETHVVAGYTDCNCRTACGTACSIGVRTSITTACNEH